MLRSRPDPLAAHAQRHTYVGLSDARLGGVHPPASRVTDIHRAHLWPVDLGWVTHYCFRRLLWSYRGTGSSPRTPASEAVFSGGNNTPRLASVGGSRGQPTPPRPPVDARRVRVCATDA